MDIELKLFASLRQYQPDGEPSGGQRIAIQPDETVADLIRRLAIPPEAVKLVFINGIHAALEQPLASGDRLGIFPAVAGG